MVMEKQEKRSKSKGVSERNVPETPAVITTTITTTATEAPWLEAVAVDVRVVVVVVEAVLTSGSSGYRIVSRYQTGKTGNSLDLSR